VLLFQQSWQLLVPESPAARHIYTSVIDVKDEYGVYMDSKDKGPCTQQLARYLSYPRDE
jgi:hypothetical protein